MVIYFWGDISIKFHRVELKFTVKFYGPNYDRLVYITLDVEGHHIRRPKFGIFKGFKGPDLIEHYITSSFWGGV